MRILIINGPNLDLLGVRDPEVYGASTLADLESEWSIHAESVNATLESYQSNHEGSIIDTISSAVGEFDGLILNAGALTHYSYAIRDAVAAVGIPTVEVHISNIYEREEWRRISVLSDVCVATVVGRGTVGYVNAIDHLVALHAIPPEVISSDDRGETELDLRVPPGPGPHPVVLLIHGGLWQDVWKRDLMDAAAVSLTRLGWATVNVGYPLGDGSYSTALRGVHSVVRWVRANALERDLGLDKVVALGHSSGGYLALQLAHSKTPLAGVLGLAAISDLAAMSQYQREDDPVEFFLGASQGEMPRLWAQAELLGHPNIPVHLVHGLDDCTVSPTQSKTYVQLHAESVSLTVFGDCGHEELIDPRSEHWPEIVAALEGFIH